METEMETVDYPRSSSESVYESVHVLQLPRVYHEANSYQRSQYHLRHPPISLAPNFVSSDRPRIPRCTFRGCSSYSEQLSNFRVFMIVLLVIGVCVARIFQKCLSHLVPQNNHIIANFRGKHHYYTILLPCIFILAVATRDIRYCDVI